MVLEISHFCWGLIKSKGEIFMIMKTQGEKAKERKDRRQSVLASGLKGGPAAVREVVIMIR